jgi:hypothetical protein
VTNHFLEIRSVALEAATIKKLALAILAAGQGVSAPWSEGARKSSGEDQQRPGQLEHLLAHSVSFGPSDPARLVLSTL